MSTRPDSGTSARRQPSRASWDAVPAGYQTLREVARREDSLLLEALWGGRRVALRLERGRGGQGAAEVQVLSQVEHPGLARLLDSGRLADGGLFVAREWVEGRALSELLAERSPKELATIVARLCPALEHLHRAGFVHADLKPANVIVAEGDHPVLTDFGLARARSSHASRRVMGTPLFIAPEVLAGEAPDVRADLFALGAMLIELLCAGTRDLRAFYGRFPAMPYLRALELEPSDLPDWSRDLIVALVELDPQARPVSAERVGAWLGGRLGGQAVEDEACLLAPWTPLRAREPEVDAVLSALEPGARSWWRLPQAEDCEAFARAILLHELARGRSPRRCALTSDLNALRTSRGLDEWVSEVLAVDGTCLISGHEHDDWHRFALETLDRAARAEGRERALIAFGRGVAPAGWTLHELQEIPEQAILEFLSQQVEHAQDARLATLAARLHAECAGSATTLSELLETVEQSGWFRFGPRGLRMRQGALSPTLGRARRARLELAQLSESDRLVLAALVAHGHLSRPAWLEEHEQLRGIDSRAAVARLCQGARVESLRSRSGLALLRASSPWGLRRNLGLDAEAWRRMHAGWVPVLERHAQSHERILAARIAAAGELDEGLYRELSDSICELRDQGCAELALTLVDWLSAEVEAGGGGIDARLSGLRGLLWAALREERRALEIAEGLDESDPELAALRHRIRGTLHMHSGRHAEALLEFEHALATGSAEVGDVWNAKARLLFEGGRDDELAELVRRLDAGELPTHSRRLEINVRALAAMASFRRGDFEEARRSLSTSLTIALERGDEMREAVVRLNLGTVARRSAQLEEAEQQLQAALLAARSVGHLATEAKVLAQLGGTLRDRGRLLDAEPLLLESVRISSSSGDRAGSMLRRGVLALNLAERGHARAALTELEVCLAELEAGAASTHVALLSARELEMRARIGPLRPGDLAEPELRELLLAAAHEPRVPLYLARAAMWSGQLARASELLEQALEASVRLSRPAEEEESRLLRAWLQRPLAPGSGNGSSQLSTALLVELRRLEWRAPLTRGLLHLLELLSAPESRPERALEQAQAWLDEGRDDWAARLALALATRLPDPELARRARALAERGLENCTAGLSEQEARHFRATLSGLPDPWPDQLEAWESDPEAEIEMNILSVLEINRKLVAQEDLPTLLGAIVESALEVTEAERGFLLLQDGEDFSLDLALDSVRGDISGEELELSTTIVNEALQRGRALRLSDARDDPTLGLAASVLEFDLRSILCQPFEIQAGLRGAIYIDHRRHVGAFDEQSERLLALLAGQAALAIRQVRRLEQIRALNVELGRRYVDAESQLLDARRALEAVGMAPTVDGLVGGSQVMREVHALLHRVGPADITVLVCGETGTGKELAARALHDLSARSDGPFVSENCAALPESLFESELFGYRKGAFTGAQRDAPGLFERAHGGTLFLDEVGELSLEMQAKLLRVLETRRVRRLGGEEEVELDFRLVCATNRELEREVAGEAFRADLLYRLDGVRILMPPLEQRVEDIPALVDHFLRLQLARDSVPRALARPVLARLMERAWPGNVRELANEVQRLCVLSDGDLVDPELVRPAGALGPRAAHGAVRPLAELEREAIENALERTGQDKGRAAKLLGISRAKLYQRLKDWREAGTA